MSDIEKLQQELNEVIEQGNRLADEVDTDPTDGDKRKALRSAREKMNSLHTELEEMRADADAAAALRAAKPAQIEAPSTEEERPKQMYGSTEKPTSEPKEFLTPGEIFVRSAEYGRFLAQFPDMKRVPDGYVSEAVSIDNIPQLMGLRTSTQRMRTLITSSDTSAGDLVRPDWRGLIEPGLWAPRGIVNFLTVIPTSSDSIQYVKETSHGEVAAFTAEATAATGTSGTKPEGSLVFDIVTDTVKTMAVWVPATKRILADASGLAAYINSYLTNDLGRELEDQIINGDGTGENFTGLLNAGIGTEVAGSGPFYALRAAKTDVQMNARTMANTILANPQNVEEWDLLVEVPQAGATVNAFVGGGPYAATPRSIWGMRVVESEFVPEGTAIVGDFSFAVLYDRESVNLSVGTINDDFIRNIVRVLGEMRAGFGVIRPAAFEAVSV